jgi:hypothetical protein
VYRQELYINRYLPIAILYFFLNGFLLPQGLLYTTLLTPLFLVFLIRSPLIKCLPIFFLIFIPYAIIHFINGVQPWYYFRSFLLFFSVFVFGLSFYQFLENCDSMRTIYKNILLLNIVMVFVSLIAFFIPSLKDHFWYTNPITAGIASKTRLKMLTYEPSYYSTLFAPIAIYYLLKLFRSELPNPLLYCVLILVPLILSLSFGVILGIALSLIIILLINSRETLLRKSNMKYIFAGLAFLVLFFAILLVFFPNNLLFLRLSNVFLGKDTSFRGRTLDSFILGADIARMRSFIFGSGLGQVKVLGLDLFKKYYNYTLFTQESVGIPNSVGDTLATFGLSGVLLKLCLEIYFFFKTKVYSNHYRLALFIFIFIYQFTGSFIMNIAEYLIWILAFKESIFSEFDKKPSLESGTE